VVLEEGDGNI
jgi:hypothetical protein